MTRKRKHMLSSREIQKGFDKIQHSFSTHEVSQQTMIKGIYGKPQAN